MEIRYLIEAVYEWYRYSVGVYQSQNQQIQITVMGG